MKRKAFELSGISNETKRNFSVAPLDVSIRRRGIQGDNLIEPIPMFNRSPSENIVKGANNTWIVLGRDRPGEVSSGYNKETGAGTIDIVVGRMASDIQQSIINDQSFRQEPLAVDNNIAMDASRIYISQKTDVDANFNLAAGAVGVSTAKAAIAIKSDAVRIIGREGVKIITRVDSQNSQGADITSIPRIDLIAGNDGSNNQPIVKGEQLNEVLKDVITRLDELNSAFDSFVTQQIEYNNTLMTHDHPDPWLMFLGTMATGNPFAINNGRVVMDPAVVQAGIKSMSMSQITKVDGIMNKLKSAITEMNTTMPFGAKEPGSTGVTVS